MLYVTSYLSIPDDEIEITAIRSQGAGGQNVNKVSSAIHLRFDINTSSLPEIYKVRLRNLNDQRISRDGVIVIKAQRFRTQEKNKADALERLKDLIKSVTVVKKVRKPTRPTKNSQKKRLDNKSKRSKIKSYRNKNNYD